MHRRLPKLACLFAAAVGAGVAGHLAVTPCVAASDDYERLDGLVYAGVAGETLRADAYVPRGEGKRPGVLLVHGGAWTQGRRQAMAGFAERIASRGYTAVTIDYRLAPKHKFPAQLEDCRAALVWMQAKQAKLKLDTTRIGGLGVSAGGHLVTLLATNPAVGDGDTGEAPARLKMAVGLAAPCDFRSLPRDEPGLAYWLGGTRAEQPDRYRDASPASFVSPDDPPVLLIHGSKDRLVPVANPRGMFRLLQAKGVPSELLVLEGGGHGAPAWRPESLAKMVAFFSEHLPPVVGGTSEAEGTTSPAPGVDS
ncbi:MAG: alpha/beta hydrolase [Planctomycetota bacterium]